MFRQKGNSRDYGGVSSKRSNAAVYELETGTIGSGETFYGHNSASYDASGVPAGTEVKVEAQTEATAHALDDDDQVIQSQWSVSDSTSWTMPHN